VEDDTGPAYPGRPLDQRHLSERARPLVRVELGDNRIESAARGRVEADREVRTATHVVHGVDATRRQCGGSGLQERRMLPPGLDEIVLVEPQGDGDRVPETVEIRFAEDLQGPTRLGAATMVQATAPLRITS
jgi:hypothetical protein